MKSKIIHTIWGLGVLSLALFCLSACNRELDVSRAYPFKVKTMPVRKDIAKGQTAEIRCSLLRQGRFADARYTIRYSQLNGKVHFIWKMASHSFPTKEEFRLY